MTYHFIGLGGIGMSALARILLQKGDAVKGSDLRSTPLLEALRVEGASVHIGHDAELLNGVETVVYGTDIKENNVEWSRAKERNLNLIHRSDLLSQCMEGKKSLLVSGTHGKTTTSALLAAVLMEAGCDPSFALGGILRSLNTNGRSGNGEYFVAEADESDGSFLKPPAFAAILTNLENDHLDYWGSPRLLDLAFQQFIAQTQHLFWCIDDERLNLLQTKGTSYGFSEKADLQITHFRQTGSGILFNLGQYKDIELSLLGRHNALNGAAVFGLALSLHIDEEAIRRAFRAFSGTARRLEFKGEKHKLKVFDDYAHHPNEIKATLKALRDHIRERRLVVVFQPHRYTRVRDLFEEFTDSFSDADLVVMTDIYSAGEAPIPGITSAALLSRMREKRAVHFFPRTHLESGVASLLRPLDVVVTVGAGDVTHAAVPILNHFEALSPKLNVSVLYGGTSPEHEVSCMSAKNVIDALNSNVYNVTSFCMSKEGQFEKPFPEIVSELLSADICIPVFHGPRGEDGMIAGFLETLGVAYVGCDFRSAPLCMHKGWTKQVVMHHNVPVVPFIEIAKDRYNPLNLELPSFPVWIKPAHLGSSIGVSRATNREEALLAIEFAFGYDDVVLVEKEIVGRQIEFPIFGNRFIQIAHPGEIINQGAFVAYDKKYGSQAMQIVRAQLSVTEAQIGYELAERVYRACRCKGLARVDFFLDADGLFWFNEINPFPGYTDTSAFPLMWKASHKTIEEQVDEMVVLALRCKK